MEIPEKWTEILTKVQTIYPEAIIAGGCLRDLDHGKEPKDIDIFVEDWKFPYLDVPLGFTKKGKKTFYFHQGADEVIKLDYGDLPVEFIKMEGAHTPWAVLNRFDFGINRIAWDGKEFYISEYYKLDKENKCVTMRSACNESHFKFLRDEKYEKRLKVKYGYPLVIPKEIADKYNSATGDDIPF